MKNKKPSQQNTNGLVSVLYRMDDVPLISLNTADMSNIARELSFYHYYCPFNTSIPLCEFDKTDQIIDHLDKKVGSDLGQDNVLVSPPRRIQAQDILLTTYNTPNPRRTCFLLLPKLDREEFKKAVETTRDLAGITLFPKTVAKRFHAVTLDGDVKGYEIIPELLDTSYRPDD